MRKQKTKVINDRLWVLSGRDLFKDEANKKAKKSKKPTLIKSNKGTGLFSLWSYADTRKPKKK
tara:strand:- start:382 stop:570 length:189 start_codon:yes stop_codon:yes gene_type:complete